MQTICLSPAAGSLQDLADHLASSGDLAGALSALEQALALAPGAAVLHEAVAQIQGEMDDPEAALRAAAKAVELAPEVRAAAVAVVPGHGPMSSPREHISRLLTSWTLGPGTLSSFVRTGFGERIGYDPPVLSFYSHM